MEAQYNKIIEQSSPTESRRKEKGAAERLSVGAVTFPVAFGSL